MTNKEWYFVAQSEKTPNLYEVQVLNEDGYNNLFSGAIEVIFFQQGSRHVSFEGGLLPEDVLIAAETKTSKSGQYIDGFGCMLDFCGNPISE